MTRYAGPLRNRPALPRRPRVKHREYLRPEYVELRRQVRRGDHGPCTYCGSWVDLTVGHLVAVVLGGRIEDGWQVECRSCNGRLGGGIRG